MSPARLVLTNLLRNKRRTFLTTASVTVALFLFCALSGIVDTLDEAIKVGSETRLITRNAVSLVFFVPLSYGQRLAQVPGVGRVAQQNWFGAQDPNDRAGFFAQFAVDENFWRVYAKDMEIVEASPAPGGIASPGADLDPKLAAYFAERTAAVVGEGLMKKKGWKVGQTVTLAGTGRFADVLAGMAADELAAFCIVSQATVVPGPTLMPRPPSRCTVAKPTSSVMSSPMNSGLRPANGASCRKASIARPLLAPPGLASTTILPRSRLRPGDSATASCIAERHNSSSAGACR